MAKYPTNDQLDNLLVGQKNYILRLINDGELVAATAALSTVREFWDGCGYGYKYAEVSKRLDDAVRAAVSK